MKIDTKFRGKEVGSEKWVYGGYHLHQKKMLGLGSTDKQREENWAHLIIVDGSTDWNMLKPIDCFEVIPETVGQYRGQKDKNGVEIYDGDILSDGEGFNEVRFIDGCFGIVGEVTGDILPFCCNPIKDEVVVGNIHDNPELLTKTEER